MSKRQLTIGHLMMGSFLIIVQQMPAQGLFGNKPLTAFQNILGFIRNIKVQVIWVRNMSSISLSLSLSSHIFLSSIIICCQREHKIDGHVILWSGKSIMTISDFLLFFSSITRVVAYLSRVLESAFTALEGLNKQAFLAELVWSFVVHHL